MYLFYPSLDFQWGNIWGSVGHDGHYLVNSFGMKVGRIDLGNNFGAFTRHERFIWFFSYRT